MPHDKILWLVYGSVLRRLGNPLGDCFTDTIPYRVWVSVRDLVWIDDLWGASRQVRREGVSRS